MLNRLHALLYHPRRGWDPVPAEHARIYAEEQWRNINRVCVDRLEEHFGSLQGKRILDLGGGPGQYSVAFAARGAEVTWHDVSRRYLEITRAKAAEHGVSVSLSLGYLEETKRFHPFPFDLVFCRICWRYCRNDQAFAEFIFSLVAPGGAAYIDTNVGLDRSSSFLHRLQYHLNACCHWKIGHPNPPPQRLWRCFSRLSAVVVDCGSSATNDRLLVVKRTGQNNDRAGTCGAS